MFVAHKGRLYPSLSAEILRVAQGASTFVVKSSGASGQEAFGEATGIVEVKVGQIVLPTDKGGRVLLHDTGPVPDRSLAAWKVFEATEPLPRLEGAIAIIGTSAVGLKDQQTTPLDPNAAGVTVHAQVIEQAFFGDFLLRPDWADGAEILLLLFLGGLIILIFALPQIATLPATLFSLGIVGAGVAASWYAYTDHALLLDPIYPGIMGIAVYTSASLLRFVSTERERKQIRTAFGQYMAPALIERLAQDPGQLRLGGEIRPLTLLFCDIRGFTTISEKLNAEELTHLINRFLTPMTNIIMSRQGTIDKYMGDCIMAFWNAPLDVPDHGRQGVDSALAMRERLVLLNSELKLEAAARRQPDIEIGIGIGLNTGEACVGNVGSDQRFDYSALGDSVNLASRLEGQCKTYGVEIVVSESTKDEVKDYAVLELDLITVKGKTVPIRIFTVLGDSGKATDPAFQALADENAAMIDAFRAQRWDDAAEHLAAARQRAGGLRERLDEFYDLYEARIASFRMDPPPADWDGVYVSREK
jgi:adenylate cyclase